jgi:hypothetical protein
MEGREGACAKGGAQMTTIDENDMAQLRAKHAKRRTGGGTVASREAAERRAASRASKTGRVNQINFLATDEVLALVKRARVVDGISQAEFIERCILAYVDGGKS